MFRGSQDNDPTKCGASVGIFSNSYSHSNQPPINKEHIIPPDEVEPKIATNAAIFGEKTIANESARKDPPSFNSAQRRRKLASQDNEY